jgi:phosphatidyl-myo-inositol alpha-mannosyltransferase
MNIGMVTEFYYPHRGGISEHVRSLSLALNRRGHTVTVITGGMPAGQMEPGPPVVRLGRSVAIRYNGSLSRVTVGAALDRGVRGVLRDGRFDLLHLHNPLMPTLPYLALRHAPCPVVATLHSGYPRDRWAELFRNPLHRLLDRASLLFPVSGSALRAVQPFFRGNYRIIPNGVDFEFFSGAKTPAPSRPPASSQAGTSDDPALRETRSELGGTLPRRILFVGAAVPRKGLPVMLEAYSLLRGRREGLELWVAGDGPLLKRARRAVPERLRGEVRFLGSCDRQSLRACHAAADLLCAPSLGRESFGMVLLEAMAAGVPVIASDIDGYAEVVDPGVDGLLVSPGDPVALAGAMDYLLGDPGLASRLVRAGRRKAAGLRWDRIAGVVEAAYQEARGLPGTLEPAGMPVSLAGGAGPEPASVRTTVLGMKGLAEGSSD